MTVRTTIGLALVLFCAFAAGLFFAEDQLVFVGRKFLDLISWLAFWH